MSSAIKSIELILNKLLDNVYISTSIKVFLGLYAAFAAPQLPPVLLHLFDTMLFRIIVAFTIIYMSIREPSIAILMAIAFIITLQYAQKYKLMNTSLSVALPNESSWLPSAKTQSQPEKAPLLPHHSSAESEDIDMMKMSNMSAQLQTQPAEIEGPETIFTSQAQYLDAQNNEVPGSDQGSCVQTWKSQQCIQGIQSDAPQGYSSHEFSSF